MVRWLCLLLVVVLVGCNRSLDAQLAGSWTESSGTSLVEQMVHSILPKVTIVLKSDHTFSLSLPTLDMEVNGNSSSVNVERRVEGTWAVSGAGAVFHTKTTGGKPVEEVRREIADARTAEAQRAHDQLVQEAIRRQMLAAQGYSETDQSANSAASNQQMPDYVKKSDELVLPDRAELSDDGRKLTLRFSEGATQPVELERQ